MGVGGPDALVEALQDIGVDALQLHLDPLRVGAWSEAETIRVLAREDIVLRSGMMSMEGEDYSSLDSIRRTGGVRPQSTWATNREAALANAKLARRLGLDLVTFHGGFLPHERADPERKILLERLREIADIFGAEGVRVGLETGQESAATLLEVLADLAHPTLGVNFDPANMILYGMGDPIAALRELAPHVLQVHIKDAKPASSAGQWGEEVCVGTGAVDWRAFFGVLREQHVDVDCMIEREAGSQRIEDMTAARVLVEQLA